VHIACGPLPHCHRPWTAPLCVCPGANQTNVDAIASAALCNCTAMPPAPPTPPPSPVNASVPNLATLSLVLSTGNNNSVLGVCDALANTVAQALTLVRRQPVTSGASKGGSRQEGSGASKGGSRRGRVKWRL
jgi:hypothetical protein